MKLISLKRPKEKDAEKAKASPSYDAPSYGYGTAITLTDGVAEKFDALDGCSVDQVMNISGKVKVLAIRSNESVVGGKPKKTCTVELQLTDISIEPDNSGDMQSGFDAASEDESEDED